MNGLQKRFSRTRPEQQTNEQRKRKELKEMTEERYQEISDFMSELNLLLKTADAGTHIPFPYSTEEYVEWQIRSLYQKLLTYRNENNWESFCDLVVMNPRLIPFAMWYYEEIPDEYKRDFIISCYINHGDFLPAVRKAVRQLPKNGINELPEGLRHADYITVYRAGEEELSKAQYRLSWTTSKEQAFFFLNEYIGAHAKYLYEAKICPCDVIAYCDDRSEKEILQYRKVYDIHIIEIAKKEKAYAIP